MFVRITVTQMAVQETSDSHDFPPSSADEDYLLVSGATSNEQRTVRRITPTDDDHFNISGGESLYNILLWEGFLGAGSAAFFTVAVRDRKNALWNSVLHAAETASLTTAAILLEDPALGQDAVQQLTAGAAELIHDLAGDNDKTLGAFTVRLTTADGTNLQTTWQAADSADLLNQPADPMVQFSLHGENAKYQLTVAAEVLALPEIVNVHSGKCLDIPDSRLDVVQVQQFTINGRGNQRWYLKTVGTVTNPAARIVTRPEINLPGTLLLLGRPSVAILNSWSGKALDVAGGSSEDQAPIQQYSPHYGTNQQFVLVDLPGQNGSLIINVHSGKALDVADAATTDGGLVQQFTVHGHDNQRWTIQH